MTHFLIALVSLLALSGTLTFIAAMVLQNADKIMYALQLDDETMRMKQQRAATAVFRNVPRKSVRARLASAVSPAPAAL